MLLVVTVKGKEKKIACRFSNDNMETAISMGKDIVRHNKVKVLIMLKVNREEKAIVVKKIEKNWRSKVKEK